MMRPLALLTILSLFLGCSRTDSGPVLEKVDPFIGTGGHGHTYPGATLPFGMVQLSPDTRLTGWDGCSGYHYSDRAVYGFSHTHLSGTGVSDYGDILLMPTTGELRYRNGADGEAGYLSGFSKKTEEASPGYYSVLLDDYQVLVELTATQRTGLHRYTFRDAAEGNVIIDLQHRDEVLQSGFRVVSDYEVEGYRISKAWAEDQRVYFVIRFSRPIRRAVLDGIGILTPETAMQEGTNLVAGLEFDLPKNGVLEAEVAISAVDQAGARNNLEAAARLSFDDARAAAEQAWEAQLGKVEIKADPKVERIFYTGLYHNFIVPNLFQDADGRYRGVDGKVHRAAGHEQYTVFSLWDTYRATHPLYTILETERTVDFIRSFLNMYRQRGELPVWELAGNETYCMIGYHAVSVIADAYLKGIRDFDADLALEAMIATANADNFGKKAYIRNGFILSEEEPESVSKTLEYAYNDWCIARMAKAMGKEEVYHTFLRRAQSYKNLLDPETGFMRPKNRYAWVEPFDPREVNFHFTEANSWQYSFYVPQDVEGLARLLGGPDRLEAQLDELFSISSQTTGRNQADITGLIGQYAHGNEPSHHMAYLYNYLGKPWKGQARIDQILTTLYDDQPDGLSGNEDCGQMSAWYVFSALGFYPVSPGDNQYVLGRPLVESAVLNLENGNTFTITVNDQSAKNRYIQAVRLNGTPYSKTYLTHDLIMAGGNLEFDMGPEPNEGWGSTLEDRPRSAITEHLITPVPVITSGKVAFWGDNQVELACPLPDAEIYYTLDGSDPTPEGGMRYVGPISIAENTLLRAVAIHPERGASAVISTRFFRIPENRSITLGTDYAPQYAAGGDEALIDFMTGGTDFRTGEWQGYHGVDLVATVDLGKVQRVRSVGINFLQDENSWIFMPTEVLIEASRDGKRWENLARIDNAIPTTRQGGIIKTFRTESRERARYLRITGKNRGVCPPDHKGAGEKAWIFADEITIE